MAHQQSDPHPIWQAAVMAAQCQASSVHGLRHVRWQPGADVMRYAAQFDETVEPFGVRLAAGDVLEVRWHPNQSECSVTVMPAGHACS